jgi:hypothetical protein
MMSCLITAGTTVAAEGPLGRVWEGMTDTLKMGSSGW